MYSIPCPIPGFLPLEAPNRPHQSIDCAYDSYLYLLLDLDNTLYPASTKILFQMGQRIHDFFMQKFGLPREESQQLAQRYYRDYGLAIKGLIMEWYTHAEGSLLTNPLAFHSHSMFDGDGQDQELFEDIVKSYDEFVDGGLELEGVIGPGTPHDGSQLKHQLFSKLKPNVRVFLFTNAGIRHAQRVLKILGLKDYFDGIIYCDYAQFTKQRRLVEGSMSDADAGVNSNILNMPCAKPDRVAYERARLIVDYWVSKGKKVAPGNVTAKQCFFVDDSLTNVQAALDAGWHAVLVDEEGRHSEDSSIHTTLNVQRIENLATVLPCLFEV